MIDQQTPQYRIKPETAALWVVGSILVVGLLSWWHGLHRVLWNELYVGLYWAAALALRRPNEVMIGLYNENGGAPFGRGATEAFLFWPFTFFAAFVYVPFVLAFRSGFRQR